MSKLFEHTNNDHESEHGASGEENKDNGEENEDGIEMSSNPSSEEQDNTITIDEEIVTNWDDLFILLELQTPCM